MAYNIFMPAEKPFYKGLLILDLKLHESREYPLEVCVDTSVLYILSPLRYPTRDMLIRLRPLEQGVTIITIFIVN